MEHNKKLMLKVLTIGIVISVLSYLFHPEVGQFSIMHNGQPIADPLVRFAAVPTFFAVIAMTSALTILLFFGFGVLIFLACLFVALLTMFIIAPYFWPILLIILIIALTEFGHDPKASR